MITSRIEVRTRGYVRPQIQPLVPRGRGGMNVWGSGLKSGYMSSIELRICMHMVFFDFKSGGADKRVDYRGGTIKNHQKSLKEINAQKVQNMQQSQNFKTPLLVQTLRG